MQREVSAQSFTVSRDTIACVNERLRATRPGHSEELHVKVAEWRESPSRDSYEAIIRGREWEGKYYQGPDCPECVDVDVRTLHARPPYIIDDADVGLPCAFTKGTLKCGDIVGREGKHVMIMDMLEEEGDPYRDHVRKIMRENKGHYLPVFVPPRAFEALWQEAISEAWGWAIDRIVDDTFVELRDRLHVALKRVGIGAQFVHLEHTMCQAIDLQVQASRAECTETMEKMLKKEHMCFTENHYLIQNYMGVMKTRIDSVFANCAGEISTAQLRIQELFDVKNESNEDKGVQDIIDWLNAYWKVAFKRFFDNIGHEVADSLKVCTDQHDDGHVRWWDAVEQYLLKADTDLRRDTGFVKRTGDLSRSVDTLERALEILGNI